MQRSNTGATFRTQRLSSESQSSREPFHSSGQSRFRYSSRFSWRLQCRFLVWERKWVCGEVEEAAGVAAVEARAVEVGVRQQALDAGELLDEADEPVGLERVEERARVGEHQRDVGQRELALVVVVVVLPAVAGAIELLAHGFGRLEREEVVDDDVGVGLGGAELGAPLPGDPLQPLEVDARHDPGS